MRFIGWKEIGIFFLKFLHRHTAHDLTAAFGKDWKTKIVFDSPNPQPIGSGCVGQVYKVKVLESSLAREDAEPTVDADALGPFDITPVRWVIQPKSLLFWKKKSSWYQFVFSTHNSGVENWTLVAKFSYWFHWKIKYGIFHFYNKKGFTSVKFLPQKNSDQLFFIFFIFFSSFFKDLFWKYEVVILWIFFTGYFSLPPPPRMSCFFRRSPAAGVKHIPNQPSKPVYVDAALKVLHPNIVSRVNRDLIIMEVGATLLEVIFRDLRWLRLRDGVLEFSSLMNRQLDLRVEAQNLTRFRHNFRNFPSVRFPVPYYPFVTQRIVLESWEDGIPLGRLSDAHMPNEELKKELASIGVDALLKMIFIDNFAHADMHPGNLFVKVTGECTFGLY